MTRRSGRGSSRPARGTELVAAVPLGLLIPRPGPLKRVQCTCSAAGVRAAFRWRMWWRPERPKPHPAAFSGPGGCITRASRKTPRASGRQMRATHPLALLATATAAVHHPGITGTSFGGSRRNRGPPRTGMVKPNLAIRRGLGRRIRLRGLLRKSPVFAGLFYSRPDGRASPVHHDIEDRAPQSAGTERGVARKALG